MGKFTSQPFVPRGPFSTTGEATTTFEGGRASARDAKSALFLLAVTNMVSEDAFYEQAPDRDDRFRSLIQQVTREDPDWVARFVPFLRNDMGMRSASIVIASESALARRWHRRNRVPYEVVPTIPVRKMVADALQRADEPAEFVAYWKNRTGKVTLPGGVQRGVADAVQRLYTERAALKYDGTNRTWRMADVIALSKPHPVGQWQSALFDFLADRRWNRDTIRVTDSLPTISTYQWLKEIPQSERRAYLLQNPDRLREAGLTWEEFSSMGQMDREAWEAMIPNMGLMALARNLRNFDEAGVSDRVAEQVISRLSDPQQVRKSKQFPYRFWSAYRNAPSLRWGYALEKALTASTSNLPELPGKTLVLVDTSGSMTRTVSEKSSVTHVDLAALFGVCLTVRNAGAELVGFATGSFRHEVNPFGSVLPQMRSFSGRVGSVGHGTETVEAVRRWFTGQDRVVIISDQQAFASRGWGYGYHSTGVSEALPESVPVFGVDTTGYANTSIDTSKRNRFEIGGLSDRMFTLMDLLVKGQNADWPF